MPIGMLTRKIQCQSSALVRIPPSRTPIDPPPDATKPKIPIAFARSAGSVKSRIVNESETADATAPPMPCTALAVSRRPCDVARPQQSEASVNSAMPATNRRRWPYRSPSRPPSSRKPPNVSRYALTTHASDVCENPRSALIDGSATFTIVVSRTIIRVPRQRTISASQRVRLSMVIGQVSFRRRFNQVDSSARPKLIGADACDRRRSGSRHRTRPRRVSGGQQTGREEPRGPGRQRQGEAPRTGVAEPRGWLLFSARGRADLSEP